MKKEFNHKKIKEAIRTILTELGDDPDREGLKELPTALHVCMTKFLRVCDTPMTKSLKCLTNALRLTQTTL